MMWLNYLYRQVVDKDSVEPVEGDHRQVDTACVCVCVWGVKLIEKNNLKYMYWTFYGLHVIPTYKTRV